MPHAPLPSSLGLGLQELAVHIMALPPSLQVRLPPSLGLGLQELPVRLAPLPAGAEVSITGDVLPSLQRFLTMEVSRGTLPTLLPLHPLQFHVNGPVDLWRPMAPPHLPPLPSLQLLIQDPVELWRPMAQHLSPPALPSLSASHQGAGGAVVACRVRHPAAVQHIGDLPPLRLLGLPMYCKHWPQQCRKQL